MIDPKIRQVRDRLIQDYPDCPQREMALQLLRRGHLAQAEAWIKALDELRENGRTRLFSQPAHKKGGAA